VLACDWKEGQEIAVLLSPQCFNRNYPGVQASGLDSVNIKLL